MERKLRAGDTSRRSMAGMSSALASRATRPSSLRAPSYATTHGVTSPSRGILSITVSPPDDPRASLEAVMEYIVRNDDMSPFFRDLASVILDSLDEANRLEDVLESAARCLPFGSEVAGQLRSSARASDRRVTLEELVHFSKTWNSIEVPSAARPLLGSITPPSNRRTPSLPRDFKSLCGHDAVDFFSASTCLNLDKIASDEKTETVQKTSRPVAKTTLVFDDYSDVGPDWKEEDSKEEEKDKEIEPEDEEDLKTPTNKSPILDATHKDGRVHRFLHAIERSQRFAKAAVKKCATGAYSTLSSCLKPSPEAIQSSRNQITPLPAQAPMACEYECLSCHKKKYSSIGLDNHIGRCWFRHKLKAGQLPCELKEEIRNCTICLDTMDMGAVLAQPRCGHLFHALCINKWLDQQISDEKERSCPLCMVAISEPRPRRPTNTQAFLIALNSSTSRVHRCMLYLLHPVDTTTRFH